MKSQLLQISTYTLPYTSIYASTRPVLAGPVYCTSGISQIFHIIMKLSLAMILHIAKDSFNFKNTLDKHCLNRTTHSTYDIKS